MNFFAVLIILVIGWFCVFQIIGFIKDFKKRKAKKNEELKESQAEPNKDNEQN